jgi:hypothetical protein
MNEMEFHYGIIMLNMVKGSERESENSFSSVMTAGIDSEALPALRVREREIRAGSQQVHFPLPH